METIPLISLPLVSICIPCFNAEKYIDETITCLIKQDYPSIEIIIVDDHSSDDSFLKIKKLAQQYPNISFAQAEKKGAAAARNQAYQLSKGDFIVFFDVDDLIEPLFISSQLKQLDFSTEDCVISSWGRFTISKETFKLDTTSICNDLTFHDWIVSYWSTASNMTIPGRVLMSRQLVQECGGWNEVLSLNDDFQFFSSLFSKAKYIRYNQDVVLMYRSNINGLSSKTTSYASQSSNLVAISESIAIALSKFDDFLIKQACVNLLQKFIFDNYPSHKSLQKLAIKKINTIGVRPSITFTAGGYTKILSRLIGWKNTKRIKYIISR